MMTLIWLIGNRLDETDYELKNYTDRANNTLTRSADHEELAGELYPIWSRLIVSMNNEYLFYPTVKVIDSEY